MAKKTLPAPDGSSSTPTPATTTRKRTTRRAPAAAGTSTGELAVAGAGMGAAEMNAIVATATDGRYDPAFHEIAEAAYLRYLQRGGHHGRDFDDWIEAERELRRRARR